MSHLFLSYASEDAMVAQGIVAMVERSGVQCWIASRDISPGEEWPHAIMTAIAGSRLMAVVVSTATSFSPHVLREVHQAVRLGIPLCPLRVHGADATGGLDYYLSTCQWLDVESVRPAHAADALAKRFSRLTAKLNSPPSELAQNLNPTVAPYYCLIRSAQVVPLTRTRLTIGRSRDCDVILDDPRVSRSHCSLNWLPELGTYSLIDHGAPNTVSIGGEAIHEPRPLMVGDEFQVGQTVLLFNALKNCEYGASV